MIDERFASSIRSWLGRTDTPPRHPHSDVGAAMARIRQTRQRRRWLWFLPGPKPTAGADDREDRVQPPAPTMTTSGLAPAPVGGTRTMFTAPRLVAMAAIGGLLTATLFATIADVQPEPPPPAAESTVAPGDVTPVSGYLFVEQLADPGVITEHDWGTMHTGELWLNRYQMDDPRLTGASRAYQNAYGFEDPQYGPRAHAIRLENAEGSWVGTGYAYQDPTTTGMYFSDVFTGEGGYEGLTAILQYSQETFSGSFLVTGVIFSGPMPATPEGPPPPSDRPSEVE